MGVKWQVFLERGGFQRYKERGLKNVSPCRPPDPTLLPSIAVHTPPFTLILLRGPWLNLPEARPFLSLLGTGSLVPLLVLSTGVSKPCPIWT